MYKIEIEVDDDEIRYTPTDGLLKPLKISGVDFSMSGRKLKLEVEIRKLLLDFVNRVEHE